MLYFRFLLPALVLLPALALAQVAEPDTVAPRPLTFYGFVDGYFGYDFQDPASHVRPGFLYSHNRTNEFALNQGLIGARYQDKHVRAALGLHAGTYPEANYAAEPGTFKNIYEAYAGFRPTAKTWLDVGVFTSHIGLESAISKDNLTLTRSLLADNSPYFETGARFTYEASAKLTLTALVLNGWQNIRDTNRGKAFGTQLQWKPTEKLLLNSSTFFGNEQPQDSARRYRYFHDFYLTYTTTDRLSLAVVFDIGKQRQAIGTGTDTWHAGAAFARYKLSGHWAATARAEYYYADHGVLIAAVAPAAAVPSFLVRGASLNLDYAPAPHVLARVEGRVLHGRALLFTDAAQQPTRTYGNLTTSLAFSF
ncbi:MAG: porin [Janthinobacterium lividum]